MHMIMTIWTPLHRAAENNESAKVVETLIKNGAEIEALDDIKRTPLHKAAMNNCNAEVVKTLIKMGASIYLCT